MLQGMVSALLAQRRVLVAVALSGGLVAATLVQIVADDLSATWRVLAPLVPTLPAR
jgi:hypothetical protein